MKSLVKTTSIIAVIIFMVSCAGGATTPGASRNPPKDYSTYPTLADALRTVGGIQVGGTGQSLKVTVRGGAANSLTQDSAPLFVIDSVPVGSNYNDAASIVNTVDIESIQVLAGSRAVIKYGEQASAGVIEIKTKSN